MNEGVIMPYGDLVNHPSCNSCNGLGRKTITTRKGSMLVDCNRCSGSGINYSLYKSSCDECGGEVVYKDHKPRFCKNCMAKREANKRTTRCEDCGTELTYYADSKYGPPKRCNNCKAKREANKRTTRCEDCGTELIYFADSKYGPPKRCNNCKAKHEANKRTKKCEAKGCNNEIIYYTDISNNHIPKYCRSCKEEVNKFCNICGSNTKVKKYYQPPILCDRCRNEQEQIRKKSKYSHGINDHIRFLFELDYYQEMGLEEARINGKKCLIYKGIDFSYKDQRDEKGRSNYQRMIEGLSPYTNDGKGRKYELHHIGQNQDSPFAELESDEHGLPIHLQNPSSVNRSIYASEKLNHWRARVGK